MPAVARRRRVLVERGHEVVVGRAGGDQRRADRFHLDRRELEDALGTGGAIGEVGDLVGPCRYAVGKMVGGIGELLKPILVEPVDVAQLGEAGADLAGCHVEGDGGLAPYRR